MTRTHARAAFAVAVCLAMLSACSSSDDAASGIDASRPSPSTTATSPTESPDTTLATTPATDPPVTPVPSTDPPAAVPVADTCPSREPTGIECLRVAVPVEPGEPDGATIDLAVTVLRADPDEWNSPVLSLVGPTPAYNWADPLPPVEGHDTVWVDQRGVGRSHPIDECSDLAPFQAELNSINITPALATALHDCVQRAVTADVPLASVIDHDVLAADLGAVRRALGIDHWGVRAHSSALDAVMRSMVLDPGSITAVAAITPLVNGGSRASDRAEQTFATFAADCAALPACAALGDMNDMFDRAIERVGDGLVTQTVSSSTGDPVVISAPSLINGIDIVLTDVALAPLAPTLLQGMADGSGIELVAGYYASRPISLSPIGYVLDCQPLDTERPAMSSFSSAATEGRFGGRTWQPECDALGPIPSIPTLPKVESDVPVLAIDAAYDSRSTIASATSIFAGFPNTEVVGVPGIVSVFLQLPDCYDTVMASFFDDPASVDVACLTDPAVTTLE